MGFDPFLCLILGGELQAKILLIFFLNGPLPRDHERPVDSLLDLEDSEMTLLLPQGAHYAELLRTSPFPDQRKWVGNGL